jgi:class 3 adenylate cyclase
LAFKDECEAAVRDIVKAPFNTRHGREVPTTESVTLSNGGVYLNAAYLYADMVDSTGMAEQFTPHNAAKIIRAYLHATCRVLRDRGGAIRSFDGDRVMAIFVGDDAANDAVDAALRIKWVVDEIVHDKLMVYNEAYSDHWIQTGWKVKHRTGVDVGTAFVVRAGVRDKHNDLVSIGTPPNIAAKLSDYKGAGPTTITERVWDKLSYENCFTEDGAPKWSDTSWQDVGGTYEEIRTSTWRRSY